MKILHINSYYSVSKFYKNLYEEQKKHNLDIDVYVPISKARDASELKLGDYTKISKNHGKYDRLFFHFKHLKILNDIVKKYKIGDYSLTHAHSLFSNGYISYKLYKKYNIPYIVAVRSTDINVFFKKMVHLRKLGIDILRNAQKIIFISEPYKEYTIKEYIPSQYKKEIRLKSTVITNGISDFWIKNKLTKKEKPKNNEINVIQVGDIIARKNVGTTIEACKILIDKGYKVSLKIVGKIKNDKYNSLIKQSSFIQYIPFCSKEELIKHYRNSDIFVMPSKNETFGIVYAEAMSQGLPIIYTRDEGFDGQFEEGEVGYAVEYDSAEEIALKIIKIMEDYTEISRRSIANIDQFDWNYIVKEYDDIYNKI